MPEHLVRKSIGLRLRGVHAQGHERRETDSLVAGEEATGQRSTANCIKQVSGDLGHYILVSI